MEKIENYSYSSYSEYINNGGLTDIGFVLEMISLREFIDYHQEVGGMNFQVSDRKKKTDDDVIMYLKKKYNIDNPKSISKFSKVERDKVLAELKKEFTTRQLQRITGISRGVITKA